MNLQDTIARPSILPTTCRTACALLALLLPPLAASAQAQHDCVPYEPTVAGKVYDDPTINWGQAFEKDKYQFTVPDDPGGGYVIARVETSAPSQPAMLIIPPLGSGGVITQQAPTQPASPNPQVLEVAFEVDSGITYDVVIQESVVSSTPAFPVHYKWSWTFISRVDCYEENDGRANNWPSPVGTSKTIPVDQVLEAYGLAGHQSYGIAPFDDNNHDWYDFTINAPTEIMIGTLEVPTDQGIRVRLFDNKGLTLLDQRPQVGGTAVIGPRLLQPGTYFVELLPEEGGERQVTLSEGEQIPDHFDRPYKFIISNQDRCWPGGTRACLQDGRFSVEVDWSDGDGGSDSGELVAGGTDETAFFTFSSTDNWEMLVKVLDGCPVNAHYWVFSAATTDVAYTLRVTDNETGAVREYGNPLGQAADANTDTEAFACTGGSTSNAP